MVDNNITFDQLAEIQNFANYFSQSKEEYIICRVTFDENFPKDYTSRAISFPGITLTLVTKGKLYFQINTEDFVLEKNTVFVTGSNDQQALIGIEPGMDAECYFLSISQNFIKGINIDLNVLQNAHLRRISAPVFSLHDDYYKLIKNYLDMLYLNASINKQPSLYTKNISRSLIAALMYQLMMVFDTTVGRDNIVEDEETRKVGLRRFNYVKQFMELVHKYYTSERSVGFYADKLCISPKYLSFIIKEVTNRTAAEWIDEYVILEAKNMLRFSGMNIQQVAYALNFNNQSSFGKYFKHLTGMSPTQFQKS